MKKVRLRPRKAGNEAARKATAPVCPMPRLQHAPAARQQRTGAYAVAACPAHCWHQRRLACTRHAAHHASTGSSPWRRPQLRAALAGWPHLHRQLHLLLCKLDEQLLVLVYLRPQLPQLLGLARLAAARGRGAAAGGRHAQHRLHVLLDLGRQVCTRRGARRWAGVPSRTRRRQRKATAAWLGVQGDLCEAISMPPARRTIGSLIQVLDGVENAVELRWQRGGACSSAAGGRNPPAQAWAGIAAQSRLHGVLCLPGLPRIPPCTHSLSMYFSR